MFHACCDAQRIKLSDCFKKHWSVQNPSNHSYETSTYKFSRFFSFPYSGGRPPQKSLECKSLNHSSRISIRYKGLKNHAQKGHITWCTINNLIIRVQSYVVKHSVYNVRELKSLARRLERKGWIYLQNFERIYLTNPGGELAGYPVFIQRPAVNYQVSAVLNDIFEHNVSKVLILPVLYGFPAFSCSRTFIDELEI